MVIGYGIPISRTIITKKCKCKPYVHTFFRIVTIFKIILQKLCQIFVLLLSQVIRVPFSYLLLWIQLKLPSFLYCIPCKNICRYILYTFILFGLLFYTYSIVYFLCTYSIIWFTYLLFSLWVPDSIFFWCILANFTLCILGNILFQYV